MKIAPPPGLNTGRPLLSADPFWFYAENVRWRDGLPETIGLFEKIRHPTTDALIQIPIGGTPPDFFADRELIFVGYDDKVTIYNANTGALNTLTLPEAGTTGRWWFTAAEEQQFTYCGRSDYFGKTYVIDRTTLTATLLPNQPVGNVAGGIVGGIFVKAGTKGYAPPGVGAPGPWLYVRWSARRTDASSSGLATGPFGFEDWTPSDLNSAGEFVIDAGSQIVGGGATAFGFVVWTDTRMYLLRPRQDQYIFSLVDVAKRGLLANQSWCEIDGRLFWYDQSKTLNVYDGGGVQQIPNPLEHVSTDLILSCGCSYLSSNPRYGEVSLHFRDADTDRFRELVYNYNLGVWYIFNLNRPSMTDAQSERPSVGIDMNGQLYFYDLAETLPPDLTDPGIVTGLPVMTPGDTDRTPEPFSFFLMTNWITANNAAQEALRSRNVVLPHATATVFGTDTSADELTVAVRSFGKLDINETPVISRDTQPVGKQFFSLRGGGKAQQYVIAANGIKTMLRFGPMDTEADLAGEK